MLTERWALQAEDTAALLKEVRSHFIPNRVLLYADGREGQDFLSSYRALMKGTLVIKTTLDRSLT